MSQIRLYIAHDTFFKQDCSNDIVLLKIGFREEP